VRVDRDRVRWSDFAQPHRAIRDYSGLGPYEFELPEYLGALRGAIATLNDTELGAT
jgi:hypothetical protein